MVGVGVVRTPADAEIGAGCCCSIERGIETGWTSTGPTPSPWSGCSASTTSDGHGHRPGQRRRHPVRRPRGLPVALHTPSEVKAAVTGSGQRRQGPGRRDGDPPAAARRTAEARPTPPTPWPWPSATSGGAAARRGSPRRSARGPGPRGPGPRGRQCADNYPAMRGKDGCDRLRQRPGRRPRPDRGGHRGRGRGGGSVSVQCTPGTLAGLRFGEQATLPPPWSSGRTR